MKTGYKFFGLALLLVTIAFADIRWGSVAMDSNTFWQSLLHPHAENIYTSILYNYRLPKMFTAFLAGSGLALAGLLLQTLFRNPIVGPYVLGISSGAGLAVALLLGLGAMAAWISGNVYAVSIAAITGSWIVLLINILLFKKLRRPEVLLVAGLMVGAFSGAVLGILAVRMPAAQLQKYFFWTTGNLGNVRPVELSIMAGSVILAYALSLRQIKYLNLMLLGDAYLQAAGYPPRRLHLFIISIAGFITGIITAVTGPLAFTGLIVPHIGRLYFKSYSHQYLLPAVFLIGGAFMIGVDWISQLPGQNGILPVNSITALIGAPLVIHLLIKNAR